MIVPVFPMRFSGRRMWFFGRRERTERQGYHLKEEPDRRRSFHPTKVLLREPSFDGKGKKEFKYNRNTEFGTH